MNEQWKRLIEAERRLLRLESTLHRTNNAITGVQSALQNDSRNVVNPYGFCDGGGGSGTCFVDECQIRLVSGVHFPGLTASTWTDGNTPNLLRFYNTTSSGACTVLLPVDNPTFGYAIMQWKTLSYYAEDASFVTWRASGGADGVAAEVRLDKTNWSMQGVISYAESGGGSTRSLFAINWGIEPDSFPRMLSGSSGSALLARSSSVANVFAIKTISLPPPFSGYVFDTLIQYLDTSQPTCSWGGTNPVIGVRWGTVPAVKGGTAAATLPDVISGGTASSDIDDAYSGGGA